MQCHTMLALLAVLCSAALASTASTGSDRGTHGEGVTAGGAPCETDLDCQLNGECTAGACVCDAAWRGANCSVLALLPAKLVNGYGHTASDVSSWGGQIARDPSTGRYVAQRQCTALRTHLPSNCMHKFTDQTSENGAACMHICDMPPCCCTVRCRSPAQPRQITLLAANAAPP